MVEKKNHYWFHPRDYVGSYDILGSLLVFLGNFDIFCTIKKWSRRFYRLERLAYIGCFRVFLGVMLLDEKRRKGKIFGRFCVVGCG